MLRLQTNIPPSNGKSQANGHALDKLPPHSIEAEQCLVGSMMLNASCIPSVRAIVTPDSFFQADHQIIFQSVMRLHDEGSPIDATLVRDDLRSRALHDEVGGDEYLAVILNKVPSAAHAIHYARIVADKSALRRLITVSEQNVKDAYGAHGDAIDVLLKAQERFAEINPSRHSPRPVPLEQLIEDYPEQAKPIVSNIIREGEVGSINAASKSMKSMLAGDLVFAVATGMPFLGTFQTFKNRVLIIDNELMKGTIAHRLPRIAAARGLTPTDYAGQIDVISLRGNLMDLYGLESQVFGRLVRGQCGLIILDALYRTLPRGVSENDNADVTHLVNVLDGCASRLGAAILFVHHSSKGPQGSKDSIDVGSGAGAWARTVDFHSALRQHEEKDVMVMSMNLRSWPPLDPACYRWTYPVWNPAPEEDPTRLKKDPRKGGRPPKDKDNPEKPQPKVWTMPDFVAAFITKTPTPKEVIAAKAQREKVTLRDIAAFLFEAEAEKTIFRHKKTGSNASFYSTVEPCLFNESAQSLSLARTPPTPPV
ncbi:MAG TPA: DnaB-like helicase N-terminal domain-containing protein [Tepidisphaeraceae bacterium]|nr:DnaB-like helicase N-terminal domain-containing protein [Tepidisphaeraceae bacterium]